MTRTISRYNVSVTRRPTSYRGPRSSSDFTDTIDELIRDLTELSTQWNNGLVKLMESLPDGSEDSSVDAFVDGIDGRTLYVDSSLTSTSSVLTYWHTTKERPNTLKEAFDNLYTYISVQLGGIQADLAETSLGLSDDIKERIGWNVFDNLLTSSATSLDGKSEVNRLNIIQLAKDMYGTGYGLGGDGQADLTYSVSQMVDALLEAHGGNWSNDITLIHSGISTTQLLIPQSATYNDSFAGSPANTQEDFNQIRTRIKTYAGTTTWLTAQPALYTAGPDSLKDLLDSCKGSSTKTSTNPWGYRYDDVSGLTSILDAIKGFLGQTTYLDGSADYPSNDFVADATSLETAVGVLDSVLGWASTPAETRSATYFRRMEVPLIGSGITVTHNKASYPDIQVIQVSPDPFVSGILPFSVKHTSLNAFDLRLVDRNDGITPSGVISSGIVLVTW